VSVIVACGYCWAEAPSVAALAHADDCTRFGIGQPESKQPCQAQAVGFCDCPRCIPATAARPPQGVLAVTP